MARQGKKERTDCCDDNCVVVSRRQMDLGQQTTLMKGIKGEEQVEV